MKTLSIFTSLFLLSIALPTYAQGSDSQLWTLDKNNMKMSDIRFNPDFMILSIPAEDSLGAKYELEIQCGNNPNFYYKRLTLSGRQLGIGRDKQMVTRLCTEALEMRDIYVRELLSTETCMRINLQYGIRSIPVDKFGKHAKDRDRNDNGFACDF
jgi:hypothetical protein